MLWTLLNKFIIFFCVSTKKSETENDSRRKRKKDFTPEKVCWNKMVESWSKRSKTHNYLGIFRGLHGLLLNKKRQGW